MHAWVSAKPCLFGKDHFYFGPPALGCMEVGDVTHQVIMGSELPTGAGSGTWHTGQVGSVPSPHVCARREARARRGGLGSTDQPCERC